MLSAPHPLPDSSSPEEGRAWASLAPRFLKTGQAPARPSRTLRNRKKPHSAVQPELSVCLLWASATPGINSRALKNQAVRTIVDFSQT